MFCCGTVGMSRLKSDGGVKSPPLSVPESYVKSGPDTIPLKRPAEFSIFSLALATIQSGLGASIAANEINGLSQSTPIRTVADDPGMVGVLKLITERTRPEGRSPRAKLISGPLSPCSARIRTDWDAMPRSMKKVMRLLCEIATGGEKTRPDLGSTEKFLLVAKFWRVREYKAVSCELPLQSDTAGDGKCTRSSRAKSKSVWFCISVWARLVLQSVISGFGCL